MKFNKHQKKTIIIGLMLIAAAFLSWLAFGAEIFTKTQVLVEKKDELFGSSYKEWENKFILGLDYTLAFSGIVFFAASIIIWHLKKLGS